jgi:hypothetical protein
MSENADLSTLDPHDELDLEGEGLQPFEDDFLIVSATINDDNENGRRWQIELQPTTEVEAMEDVPGDTVRDGGFLTHDDRPELVNIGKGSLKRVFKAAFGAASGSIADLEGKMVHARVSEGKTGFAQVRNYGPPKND